MLDLVRPAIPSLAGILSAKNFFADHFDRLDGMVEWLLIAHLNENAGCIHFTCHRGEATATDFPIRAILLDAATHNSCGVVLAHNHPSGDPRPSPTDCATTRRCATVCEAIDLTLVDHLVKGGDEWSSFRQMGLL